ncbi:MAG: hypothetical protein HC878_19285, partial [Leptolyngbyaceae cyanobacterium SL_5_14]|nr:hypothetical protein [Leptolyngbyaceae cyanobacterium SL_5_14]
MKLCLDFYAVIVVREIASPLPSRQCPTDNLTAINPQYQQITLLYRPHREMEQPNVPGQRR